LLKNCLAGEDSGFGCFGIVKVWVERSRFKGRYFYVAGSMFQVASSRLHVAECETFGTSETFETSGIPGTYS